MTQIDPRSPKATTRTAEVGEPPRKQEPPFNWRISLGMAIGLLVIAAGVSLLRGGRYVYEEHEPAEQPAGTGQTALERSGRP